MVFDYHIDYERNTMCQLDEMSAEEKRNLFIQLADDMAAAAMSHTQQSYDQLIASRTQMRALADHWLKQVEGNNQVLRSIRENLSKLGVQ